jgi:apolipoprotein N-acyltransferase
VENRRWIVRVANSGISAIIDPLGRVVQIEPTDERRVMIGDIYTSDEKSTYVIIGDTFAWFCSLLICLVWGNIIFRRLKGHDPRRSEELAGGDAGEDS